MRLKPLQSVECLYVCASMTVPGEINTGAQLAQHHRLKGYSKIAVHYVIEPDGVLFRGRPLTQPGVLAGQHNADSIQVCLLGGLDKESKTADTFTPEQYKTLQRLIADVNTPVKYSSDFPGVYLC